jgi:hypothetical protein
VVEPQIARRTWRTVEPIHSAMYFDPEARACYDRIGLGNMTLQYFASRAAPLGPVSAEVVISTFFNFCPDLVRAAIPKAWELATPERVLAARIEGAEQLLLRAFGALAEGPDIAEAARLARRAAEAACVHLEGRPLFAAHASLPWPDDDSPHLVLWHAQTLLREYRGDGHIAVLLADGLTGLEALVIHAATGELPVKSLRVTRAWPDEEWNATVEALQQRGVLQPGDELVLTTLGTQQRAAIEQRTDELSVPAYAVLGEDGCARLRSLARPLSQALMATGVLVFNVPTLPEESA